MPTELVRQLSHELDQLAATVYATNAFVFDAWGLVWCSATPPNQEIEATLLGQIKTVLEGAKVPLHKGGKLSVSFTDLSPPLYCRSFAASYVLGLWTTSNSTELLLHGAIRAALPRIESLTLLLPPPGGGDPSSGAQHGSA